VDGMSVRIGYGKAGTSLAPQQKRARKHDTVRQSSEPWNRNITSIDLIVLVEEHFARWRRHRQLQNYLCQLHRSITQIPLLSVNDHWLA